MLIACDVDGILADLVPEVLRRYNRDYDDNRQFADVNTWPLHEHVKPECGSRIYEYLRDPDLYQHVRPVEGAPEGVERLRALGHRFVFVTSCTFGMTDQKAEWLERHGFCRAHNDGQLPAELIVANQKQHIAADLLIDDGPHNVRDWVDGAHRPAIVLAYPYNACLREQPSAFWLWCHRAASWPEIVRHVERWAR